MTDGPRFSVLIPTKNRSHLVGYAIRSVLNQTFRDFEIVLVDNDDGDTTSNKAAAFNDPRIKYFRTGGLGMSENWEYALSNATGDYITILEDKQAYYPWALESVNRVLLENTYPLVLWEWDLYQEGTRRAFRAKRSQTGEIILSDEILDLYTQNPSRAWSLLPRMLNCAASRTAIELIQNHPGSRRFFDEVTPDLCSGFQLLATVDEVYVLNDALGLLGYVGESNAKKWTEGNQPSKYIGGTEDIIAKSTAHVPIKLPRLVNNIVYNDYLRIREDFGGRLKQYQMASITYLRLCLRDVMRSFLRSNEGFSNLRTLARYASDNGIGFRYLPGLLVYAILEMLKSVLPVSAKADWSRKWHADNIAEAAKQITSP